MSNAGFLRGTAIVIVLAIGAGFFHAGFAAQQYPVKPVRFVVPYPAGGPFDEVARAVAQRLTPIWGQQVLVDNRSGAGGSVGADVVAKWTADGGAGSARGARMRPGSGL